jgi:phage terminase Nu1 subunit (DNA packaging protein)
MAKTSCIGGSTLAELPAKLPARGIAILFGVSEQRISQLKRKGVLKPDSANMYSVKEAMQQRGFQMSEHGLRVVGQEFGNGTGKVAPAKITPINAVPEMSAEDRETLGIEIDEATVAPSPNSVVAAQSRISELREQKLRAELARAETRAARERGELVERAAVHTSFVEAGALVASILQNLPAEIAAIFADPDKKAEVRLKVQTRVDQAQHALYKALKDCGQDDPNGPPT